MPERRMTEDEKMQWLTFIVVVIVFAVIAGLTMAPGEGDNGAERQPTDPFGFTG